MTARTLPGLGLTGFWDLGEDGWKDANDVNLRTLSTFVAGAVKSRTVALPGSPSVGDVYIVPATDPTNPNKVAIWDGESGSEAWVYITPPTGPGFYVIDEGVNVQWTGASWEEFAGAGGGGGSSAYDVQGSFTETPTSEQVLGSILIPRGVTFSADFAGSVGVVSTNPGSAFSISVVVDSTEVGTIEIGASGVFTFTTSGGAAVSVASGDLMEFIAPTIPDASVEGAIWTLLGETT